MAGDFGARAIRILRWPLFISSTISLRTLMQIFHHILKILKLFHRQTLFVSVFHSMWIWYLSLQDLLYFLHKFLFLSFLSLAIYRYHLVVLFVTDGSFHFSHGNLTFQLVCVFKRIVKLSFDILGYLVERLFVYQDITGIVLIVSS